MCRLVWILTILHREIRVYLENTRRLHVWRHRVIVIKLGNISLCAACLVLLSGNVMSNPGPVSDPCSVCYKGCRKNQKAIQCDSCDGWFHAKCIGVDSKEYIELSDNSKCWECIQCLFPVCDSPTKGSGNSSNINIQNESSINASAEINPDLIKRGMKFAHVNIVTLPGHLTDVNALLEETNLDVFAVTESRLDATFPDCTVCPSNYVCYRKERNRFGGGCAIFVKDKWPSKRRRDLESDSLEMVCVEICPNKAKNTIVGVFYKPPSMDGDKFVTHFKQDVLSKMFDGPNKNIILMGDFNADVIAPKRSKYTRFLLNEANFHGLTQLIREPHE